MSRGYGDVIVRLSEENLLVDTVAVYAVRLK
jgi:hypothetical protein